jgi:uncharacterized protein (UPF0332 family)
MTSAKKNEYIEYRLNRARETVQEASVLANSGHNFGAINRLYYAMFYSVSALCLANDFSTSSHTQLRGYFNRVFVKTGRIAVEFGKGFGMAYD